MRATFATSGAIAARALASPKNASISARSRSFDNMAGAGSQSSPRHHPQPQRTASGGSYIHMNDSQASSAATVVPHSAQRAGLSQSQHHPGQHQPSVTFAGTNNDSTTETSPKDNHNHSRDDSGTYSTLSSSQLGSTGIPALHTIGVRRGVEIVRSRPVVTAAFSATYGGGGNGGVLSPIPHRPAMLDGNRSMPDFHQLDIDFANAAEDAHTATNEAREREEQVELDRIRRLNTHDNRVADINGEDFYGISNSQQSQGSVLSSDALAGKSLLGKRIHSVI